jgi:hypothetical protein
MLPFFDVIPVKTIIVKITGKTVTEIFIAAVYFHNSLIFLIQALNFKI